ncbi:hypothetical protein BDZ88DRAFT_468848 [Geranomyces variabilis]|nr:hypothetical protein BDZ88DRAFT_468848 [Geranomyces variabilis]
MVAATPDAVLQENQEKVHAEDEEQELCPGIKLRSQKVKKTQSAKDSKRPLKIWHPRSRFRAPLDSIDTPFKPKLSNAIVQSLEKRVLLTLATTADRVALPNSTKQALGRGTGRQRSMHSLRCFPGNEGRVDVDPEIRRPNGKAGVKNSLLLLLYRKRLRRKTPCCGTCCESLSCSITQSCGMAHSLLAKSEQHGLIKSFRGFLFVSRGLSDGTVTPRARALEVHASNDDAARSTKLADGFGLRSGNLVRKKEKKKGVASQTGIALSHGAVAGTTARIEKVAKMPRYNSTRAFRELRCFVQVKREGKHKVKGI